MDIRARYFTKICYNVNQYLDFVNSLTPNDIADLISVAEKDDKLILTLKIS